MLRKGFIVLAALPFVLLGSSAYANILTGFFAMVSPDLCTKLPGKWKGSSAVEAFGGNVKCEYDGIATIAPDGKDYKANIGLDKKKGGVACPTHKDLEFPGSCQKGKLKLEATGVKMEGDMIESGKTATISGTVMFDVKMLGKTKVDIKNMTLHKV